jgi:hypothetical protein
MPAQPHEKGGAAVCQLGMEEWVLSLSLSRPYVCIYAGVLHAARLYMPTWPEYVSQTSDPGILYGSLAWKGPRLKKETCSLPQLGYCTAGGGLITLDPVHRDTGGRGGGEAFVYLPCPGKSNTIVLTLSRTGTAAPTPNSGHPDSPESDIT